jgi:hypothetical protein
LPILPHLSASPRLCANILGFRDEVDSAIEQNVIDIVRDAVQTAVEQDDEDADVYDSIPGDFAIQTVMSRLPPNILAAGLAACANEIAAGLVRELVG